MKRQGFGALVAACLLVGPVVFAAPAFAGEGDQYIASFSDEKIDLIQDNIVLALRSGIPGMQADAAQLVRDLRNLRPDQPFSGCIVPLMRIVKNESGDQSARVLAAFALDKLESERGYFAISRTAQFTENPMLKHVCTWLTYDRKTGRPTNSFGMAIIEPLEEFGDE